MTTIYLIRHAQADGNLYRRCHAWYDSLVTETGYRQIEALADRFKKTHFDAVYSSDLFRTMTTARAIFEQHNLPLNIDPDLREINYGCWEDRTWGELLLTEKESLLEFWRCDPKWTVDGSESFPQIQARFDQAIRKIAARHLGQTVAVFAHGCIIRSSLALWLGYPADQIQNVPHGDNTSVARLEYIDGTIVVQHYNNIDHLHGDLAHAPHPASKSDRDTAEKIRSSSLYFKKADSSEHKYAALLGSNIVGALELDIESSAGNQCGIVSVLSLRPEYSTYPFIAQMIGQAVSVFRAKNFRQIDILCPDGPDSLHPHYKKLGFQSIKAEHGNTIFSKQILI